MPKAFILINDVKQFSNFMTLLVILPPKSQRTAHEGGHPYPVFEIKKSAQILQKKRL